MTFIGEDGRHVSTDSYVKALYGWDQLIKDVSAEMGESREYVLWLTLIMALQTQTEGMYQYYKHVEPLLDDIKKEMEDDDEGWRD